MNYKNLIKSKLLQNIKKEIDIANEIKGGGSYADQKYIQVSNGEKPSIYDNDERHDDNVYANRKIVQKLKAKPKGFKQAEMDREQAQNHSEIMVGGKGSIFKSLKKFGSSVGEHILNEGEKVGKKVITTGAKQLENQATQAINNMGKQAENQATEALGNSGKEASGEDMMMMAGSIKRAKHTRTPSDQTKRRHALVRKLMQEQKMSMTEANSYIKNHKLKY